jgi:hypothetical protein
MEDIKIGKGSISIWAIVAAVGGLLAFIAFFLALSKFYVDVPIVGKVYTSTYNGIDLISGKWDGNTMDHYSFWKVMPLLAMLAGLATLVLGILPIFGVNNSGVKMAFMICGIVTLVLGLLVFIFSAGPAVVDKDWRVDDWKAARQIGAYFFLIGGILAGAGACCDKFLKL